MLKQKYFLADIFILSAEKQPIKLSWRKIEWLPFTDAIPSDYDGVMGGAYFFSDKILSGAI